MKYVEKFENFKKISENLQYHINDKVSIIDNIFRPGSDAYYQLLEESRKLFESGFNSFREEDIKLFEETDLGKFEKFEGHLVPLDLPMINEAEHNGHKVELNKPMRSSGPKKYKVYVKNPKTGKVKVVNFGDVKGGLTAKISNPKARKSFSARHNCPSKKNKMQAGYWSCRLTKFPHLFSSNKTYAGFW